MKIRFFLLAAFLCLAVSISYGQTLQSVTDSGNSTTKNIWVGTSPLAGVAENALNIGGNGKVKLLGTADAYTLGTDANQPTIYRSGINTGSYPFNNFDNLMLQAGIQNRDIILLTGSTPAPRLTVTGAGNVGIGTTTPEGKLDVYGPVFINTNANLNLKASSTSPTDPGDIVFWANNNTEYARMYANPGGTDLRFSVGATPTTRMVITNTGNVGIGTTVPQAKLAVNGDIFSRKVKVTQTGWADFVFEPEYKLPSLSELETYIKTNKHLPDVPSAADVTREGLDLGEMNKILLQKIEELTLHLIDESKRNKDLEDKMKAMMDRIEKLEQIL